MWYNIENFAKQNYSCGPDRIRTGDLSIANAALYQLSYRPESS